MAGSVAADLVARIEGQALRLQSFLRFNLNRYVDTFGRVKKKPVHAAWRREQPPVSAQKIKRARPGTG